MTRTPTFKVVVSVSGNPDFTTVVDAADGWKARTRAMFNYPHPLRGQTVNYEVSPC